MAIFPSICIFPRLLLFFAAFFELARPITPTNPYNFIQPAAESSIHLRFLFAYNSIYGIFHSQLKIEVFCVEVVRISSRTPCNHTKKYVLFSRSKFIFQFTFVISVAKHHRNKSGLDFRASVVFNPTDWRMKQCACVCEFVCVRPVLLYQQTDQKFVFRHSLDAQALAGSSYLLFVFRVVFASPGNYSSQEQDRK